MSRRAEGAIRFVSTVGSVGGSTIVRLPQDASDLLPSRGQVAIRGAVNGHELQAVLEPDGLKGHWLRVEPALQRAAELHPGDTVEATVEIAPEWPEPEVPADLAAALADASPAVKDRWHDITPMARWEWVRWVNATANPATRRRRVEVSISKLTSGKRRPCCFDLAACTDPAVSRSGRLLPPTN